MSEMGLDAIWVNGSGDVHVKVVRILGIGSDLRNYVAIAGSTTGIPEDELMYLNFDGDYVAGLSVFADSQGNLHLTE